MSDTAPLFDRRSRRRPLCCGRSSWRSGRSQGTTPRSRSTAGQHDSGPSARYMIHQLKHLHPPTISILIGSRGCVPLYPLREKLFGPGAPFALPPSVRVLLSLPSTVGRPGLLLFRLHSRNDSALPPVRRLIDPAPVAPGAVGLPAPLLDSSAPTASAIDAFKSREGSPMAGSPSGHSPARHRPGRRPPCAAVSARSRPRAQPRRTVQADGTIASFLWSSLSVSLEEPSAIGWLSAPGASTSISRPSVSRRSPSCP